MLLLFIIYLFTDNFYFYEIIGIRKLSEDDHKRDWNDGNNTITYSDLAKMAF